ncbi:unnamed protein product [Leptidea sinapis]|uniref:Uncharacterized protein n=1 Tax=Leptidea sinapis TaxID=189913 RepID=A0A5E4PN02_9NEOP|nr:unnamed protein product [Leptidea sinapis]
MTCSLSEWLETLATINPEELAESTNDIDLILGGHDHVYEILEVNNKYIVKSGTDFRQFSKININFSGESPRVDISDVKINSSIAEDLVLKGKVEKYSVLGKFCVPLEGRFSCIRKQECNLGNWVCDVHPAGDFTLRDLSTIIPMRDPLVVVEASGDVILQPPGSRVAGQVVKIGDEYLQREQKYRLAIKQYL